MAHQVQDEGFHEIQLNGKQLVFLFMAATVVSVVIFLCGVLVGRGVRAERGAAPESTSIASAADATPQPAPALPAQPPAGSDPTAAAALGAHAAPDENAAQKNHDRHDRGGHEQKHQLLPVQLDFVKALVLILVRHNCRDFSTLVPIVLAAVEARDELLRLG